MESQSFVDFQRLIFYFVYLLFNSKPFQNPALWLLILMDFTWMSLEYIAI